MKYAVYMRERCDKCNAVTSILDRAGIKYVKFFLWVGQPRKRGLRYFTLSQLQYLLPGVTTLPQVFDSLGQPLGSMIEFTSLAEKSASNN